MSTVIGCTLNGVSPESLDRRIVLTDAAELAEQEKPVTAGREGMEGRQYLARGRAALRVGLRLAVREEEPHRHLQLITLLRRWAEGRLLTLTTRPGQRLIADAAEWQGEVTAQDWTQPLTLVLTAWQRPYWEDIRTTRQQAENGMVWHTPGTGGRMELAFTAENTGTEECTCLTISAGESHVALVGLTLPSGAVLTGTYPLPGVLRVMVTETDGTETSALSCLLPESDAALTVPCGTRVTFGIAADQPVKVTVSGRGLQL